MDACRPSKRGDTNSAPGFNKWNVEIKSFQILQVYVDSCRLLPSVRGRQPDPRVELFVVEDQVKKTVPIRFNRNPVFEEGFLILIPGNAKKAELKVESGYI